MGRYIIRRLIGALLVVLAVSVVTFAVFQITPILTGSRDSVAYLYVGRVADPQQVEAVAHKLGIDRPYAEQYLTYMKGIVTGRELTNGSGTDHCHAPCFGYSYRLHSDVTDLLKDRFPVTLSLAVGAAVIWLIMGVSIGVLSALRRGSAFDRAAMSFALMGVSLPVYFTAALLLLAFSYGMPFTLIPNVHWVPFTDDPGLWAQNLLLPWISLALLFAALYARLTRANMMETMSEDYVRTARAKGLTRRNVVVKHGMRAALTPIVTIFGLDLGLLLGGAILTESAFNFPGLGKLALDAINQKDLPVIMGVTILAAIFIVVANVVVDVLYAAVDPRVRLH